MARVLKCHKFTIFPKFYYRFEGNLTPHISTYESVDGDGLAGAAFLQLDQFDTAFDGASTFAEARSLDPETRLSLFLRDYGDVVDLNIDCVLTVGSKIG